MCRHSRTLTSGSPGSLFLFMPSSACGNILCRALRISCRAPPRSRWTTGDSGLAGEAAERCEVGDIFFRAAAKSQLLTAMEETSSRSFWDVP